MSYKETPELKILELLSRHPFLTYDKILNLLKDTMKKEEIENSLDFLEFIGLIHYGLNKNGQETYKITTEGKNYLEINKGPNLYEKIINYFIYNPIVRKILNLD